jgi:hypothetical protein
MPSDPERLRRWLNDIRHNITLAQTFVAGMSYEALCDDLRTTYAVTRCLEIISEASRRLPDELKARHPKAVQRCAAASTESGMQHRRREVKPLIGTRIPLSANV